MNRQTYSHRVGLALVRGHQERKARGAECPECRGEGWVDKGYHEFVEYHDCPACDGTGRRRLPLRVLEWFGAYSGCLGTVAVGALLGGIVWSVNGWRGALATVGALAIAPLVYCCCRVGSDVDDAWEADDTDGREP